MSSTFPFPLLLFLSSVPLYRKTFASATLLLAMEGGDVEGRKPFASATHTYSSSQYPYQESWYFDLTNYVYFLLIKDLSWKRMIHSNPLAYHCSTILLLVFDFALSLKLRYPSSQASPWGPGLAYDHSSLPMSRFFFFFKKQCFYYFF